MVLWVEGFERFESVCEWLFKVLIWAGELYFDHHTAMEFEMVGESLIVVYENLSMGHAPTATLFIWTWVQFHHHKTDINVLSVCRARVHCLGCLSERTVNRTVRKQQRRATCRTTSGSFVR